MTCEIAIICRDLRIPCLVNAVGISETLIEGDLLKLESSEGIIYCPRRPKYSKNIPDSIGELEIPKLVPYMAIVKRKDSSFIKSTERKFLESPETHILVRKLDSCTIVYAQKAMQFNKETSRIIKESISTDFIWGGFDLYQNYTSMLFGMKFEPKIRLLLAEIKTIPRSPYSIAELSIRSINSSSKELGIAETLIRKAKRANKTNSRDIHMMFRHINNSAIYFELSNQAIPSYAIKSIRSGFEKMGLCTGFPMFICHLHAKDLRAVRSSNGIAVPAKDFLRLYSIYKSLKKWKLESVRLDQHERRSAIWSKAARMFREKTDHKVSEFLGQFGSGYKLESFLKHYKG